jgi:hypothetical protein
MSDGNRRTPKESAMNIRTLAARAAVASSVAAVALLLSAQPSQAANAYPPGPGVDAQPFPPGPSVGLIGPEV